MKKRLSNKPVQVNKDVWFYLNEKSFSFVVWAGKEGDKQVRQFELPHAKIKEYLLSV